MKLHQLSNGNWIDLKTVTSIKSCERVRCWTDGSVHPDRVVVTHGSGIEILPCGDMEQANVMRDELAVLVNSIQP